MQVGHLSFNKSVSTVMHVDINSCFATIEQQANPYLRNKPVAVAAYISANGCILAASIEAKRYGVKTGMRVKDGKKLCPSLIILPTDPPKYRSVHLALRNLLSKYTSSFSAKSIDEFVLHFGNHKILEELTLHEIAHFIKQDIYRDIGDYIKVSIGIGPSRFLAKTAASYIKPNGLTEISFENYREIYSNLKLTDLCGINVRNEIRLKRHGIHSVSDFYNAPISTLKAAFSSILGYYWYVRLKGWEIDTVDFARRSYGNSFSLPKPVIHPNELYSILAKLVEKMTFRLRRAEYAARGVHVSFLYKSKGFWHKGLSFNNYLFETRDIFKKAKFISSLAPTYSGVCHIAVSCFDLYPISSLQLNLFEDIIKKRAVSKAMDTINERWGQFVISNARMTRDNKMVPDRIAFGGVKELEEIVSWQH